MRTNNNMDIKTVSEQQLPGGDQSPEAFSSQPSLGPSWRQKGGWHSQGTASLPSVDSLLWLPPPDQVFRGEGELIKLIIQNNQIR